MVELAKSNSITFEESIKAEQCVVITDKTIKEYIDWCKKDSILIWELEEAYYDIGNNKSKNKDWSSRELLFHPAQYVQKYKHKEPTFIGFYEWLKDKKK